MGGEFPQGYRLLSSLPDKPRYLSALFNQFSKVVTITSIFRKCPKRVLWSRDIGHCCTEFKTTAIILEYNFTHRIERLSFGDSAPGIINPLDAEEKIASQNYLIYQYYIQVVPTEIHTSRFWGSTYQYSVTEQERQIDHEHGSHGIPGIYIKYDMSPIKFEVSEERQSLRMFLVRLCAVVGGVFATSGIITSFVKLVIEWLCCLPIRGKQLSGSNQLNNTIPARPIYEANLPLIETLPDLVTK